MSLSGLSSAQCGVAGNPIIAQPSIQFGRDSGRLAHPHLTQDRHIKNEPCSSCKTKMSTVILAKAGRPSPHSTRAKRHRYAESIDVCIRTRPRVPTCYIYRCA